MQIFDFSERKQSNQAATLVPARRFGGSPNAEVLVTRVGDALQEPFWPEVRKARPLPLPPSAAHGPLPSAWSPAGPALTSCLLHHVGRSFHTCQPLLPTATTHTHTRAHTGTHVYMYTCLRAWASIAASFTLSIAPTWRRASPPSSPSARRRRLSRPRPPRSTRGVRVRCCCGGPTPDPNTNTNTNTNTNPNQVRSCCGGARRSLDAPSA